MVTRSLENLLADYKKYLGMMIHEYNSDYDNSAVWAEFALEARDDLEERWNELSEDHRRQINSLDASLKEHKEIILDSSDVKSAIANGAGSRGQWWWFLD